MAIEIKSEHAPRRRARSRSRRLKDRERAHRSVGRVRLLRPLALSLLLLSGLSVVLFTYLYTTCARIVDERLARGYQTSRAGIYAAPRTLRAGQSIARDRLVETLRRAGYVENDASDAWNGAFTVAGESIEIRPRRTEEGAHAVVRVSFDRQGRIAGLRGDGAEIPAFTLEPEVLTNDAAMRTGRRALLSYQDIPPVLTRAILAIEDRRFFEHSGVDWHGILRAVWRNAGDGEAGQGGSTITQQLVKNTYLTPERTLRRKVMEAFLSGALERRLSKEDIFALYCNEIYLGQRGSLGVRGVAQAARVYFDKELSELTLAEAATIAGMIQSPARYAPDRHPENSLRRRNLVLSAMLRDGAINEAEANAALRAPVTVAPRNTSADAVAPHFVDYVNRVADARLVAAGNNESERSGRIQTTIDLDLQRLAEAAVARQLSQLDRAYRGRATPQAALVALDPRTGHVLAMVGGRDYAASQLNRATDARRQPGSVYKPFVMAAALEQGISPVSLYRDEPRAFLYDRRAVYRPANYGNSYSMRDVTMREALVRSLNVVTVDLALRTGLTRVASLAEGFGLTRPEPYPALALGTTEATPLEIAAAYAAFANGGRAVAPAAIVETGSAANYGEPAMPAAPQVVRHTTAYMITDMLTAVIERGTGRAARGAVGGVALAGKTGTSRDGWFVGYSPNLVCVVWVGFDDNSQLGLTGAESALPVWTEFMRGAITLRPELGGAAFARPASVSTVEIDPATGMLATGACPHRERIAVTPALAPGYQCYLHDQPFPTLAGLEEQPIYDAAMMTAPPASQLHTVPAYTAAPPQRETPMPSLPRANPPAIPRLIAPARTTRVESSSDGRRTLTNEMRLNAASSDRQR